MTNPLSMRIGGADDCCNSHGRTGNGRVIECLWKYLGERAWDKTVWGFIDWRSCYMFSKKNNSFSSFPNKHKYYPCQQFETSMKLRNNFHNDNYNGEQFSKLIIMNEMVNCQKHAYYNVLTIRVKWYVNRLKFEMHKIVTKCVRCQVKATMNSTQTF